MWRLSLLLLFSQTTLSQPSFPLAISRENVFQCIQSSISCPPNSVIVPRSVLLTTLTTPPDTEIRCSNGGVDGEVEEALVACQVDVTSRVDSSCFGNYDCVLEGGLMPKEEAKCDGFKLLNISYDCLPIEQTSCFDCETTSNRASIRSSQGYLSSLLATNERLSHNCGTSPCPWWLKAEPGQTINVTFIQASLETPESTKSSDCASSSWVFQASEDRVAKVAKVCPGDQRTSHVLTSVGNSVTLFYNEDKIRTIGQRYLVHYEVLGCADIIAPRFSRMRRSLNKAIIDCPETPKLHWVLECVEGQWKGLEEVGKCPPYPGFVDAKKEAVRAEEKANLFDTTVFDMPVGVLMTFVVTSAIVLGILVLTMGVVCLKRHNYDLKHKDDPNIYGAACSEFEFKGMGGGLMTAQKFAYQQHLLSQADRQRRASGDMLARDNTYAMQDLVRMDTRPLPSLPNNASPSTTYNRQGGPVPYGVYPQSRVAVQFHRADSDVASGVSSRAFMTSRAGTTQVRPFRLPHQGTMTGHPGAMTGHPGTMTGHPGTMTGHPGAMTGHPGTMTGHHDDNHLYFVLDGSAPDEKVATMVTGANHHFPPPPTTLPHSTTQVHAANMPPPPAHNKPNSASGI